MPTEIVSGRVDANVKKIADMYIKREGFTAGEVISSVWERIAVTGEIPAAKKSERDDRKADALRKLHDLRSQVPLGTPLSTMTDDDIKEALADRD